MTWAELARQSDRGDTVAISFVVLDLTQKESFNRVGWFFRHEGDRMRCTPMLFDHDRWGQCTEAIIADEGSEICGVITLAPKGIGNSGQPTIDTLYVPKKHRKAGLGYALFEKGIRRLVSQTTTGNVFCQLQSSTMLRLVAKLPDELKTHLKVQEAFRAGDIAPDFEYIEQDLPA